jgi:hypothetical protein
LTFLRKPSISARDEAAAGCLLLSVDAGVLSFAMAVWVRVPPYKCVFDRRGAMAHIAAKHASLRPR